ncbi:hypothetical protein BCR37DRAFT_382575, partial [Protomyces lactucae-debilis]
MWACGQLAIRHHIKAQCYSSWRNARPQPVHVEASDLSSFSRMPSTRTSVVVARVIPLGPPQSHKRPSRRTLQDMVVASRPAYERRRRQEEKLSNFTTGAARTSSEVLPRRPDPERLRLRFIIDDFIKGGLAALAGTRTKFLEDRGTALSDIERWAKVVAAETVDEALPFMTGGLPAYVLMACLRKPTSSGPVVHQMLEMVGKSMPELDGHSVWEAIQLLIKHAVLTDASLLVPICTLLCKSLPRARHLEKIFSDLLVVLDKITDRRTERFCAVQAVKIVRTQMVKRRINFSHKDINILIKLRLRRKETGRHVRSRDLIKPTKVLDPVTNLPYTVAQRNMIVRRFKQHDSIQSLLLLIPRLSCQGFEEVWTTLMARRDSTPRVVRLCLRTIKQGELKPSLTLVAFMLRSAIGFGPLIQRIIDMVTRHQLQLTSGAALELVRHMARYDPLSLFNMLHPESEHLSQEILSNSHIWAEAVRKLNSERVKRFRTAGQHALVISLLLKRLKKCNVPLSTSLLSALVDAALYSGQQSMLGGKSNILWITELFRDHVDHGDQPELLQARQPLWRTYMRFLVAAEQVDLLEQTMEGMLATGSPISTRQVTLFALGLWESGDVERMGHWEERLAEYGLCWPPEEQVFALKGRLEAGLFELFR